MFKAMLCKEKKEIMGSLKKEQIKRAVDKEDSLIWVELENPTKEELSFIKDIFKLHPLTVEDCVNTNARPKIDQFPSYLFLILHAAGYHPKTLKVKTIELNICVGKNFLLTIHMDPIPSLKTAWARAEKNLNLMCTSSDNLLHQVIDSLVDNYFPVIDMLDSRIDKVENEVFSNPTEETLKQIFSIKNDIFFLRRAISPQRETINLLAKGDHAFINPAIGIYFRDIGDNLMFILDTIDTYRDTVSSALDAYLSNITNKTNEIMKTLTVIATIMMPLSVITGIYGMNFKFMPEIGWKFGYLGAYILMAIVACGMLIYFKKNKWF
ncbi:MAG: magnesium/cobalt transporter CorA [Candidatus Omnitrophica bacterium]|nr:magnesium/cobalt transporter CorA [Candidatus Omnitrophota bacterium]